MHLTDFLLFEQIINFCMLSDICNNPFKLVPTCIMYNLCRSFNMHIHRSLPHVCSLTQIQLYMSLFYIVLTFSWVGLQTLSFEFVISLLYSLTF